MNASKKEKEASKIIYVRVCHFIHFFIQKVLDIL